MIDAVFRPLSDGDRVLLGQATLGNVNWNGDRFTVDQVRETEALAHYLEFDPERGDFGIVAERDGRAVGVPWAFFLPAEDPGFGYVDAGNFARQLYISEGFKDVPGSGVGAMLRQLRR